MAASRRCESLLQIPLLDSSTCNSAFSSLRHDSDFDPDQKYLVFSHAVGIDTGFIRDQHLNKKLEVNTLNGFLKLNLVNQDFLHKNYAFVLARQMIALGHWLPKELLTLCCL